MASANTFKLSLGVSPATDLGGGGLYLPANRTIYVNPRNFPASAGGVVCRLTRRLFTRWATRLLRFCLPQQRGLAKRRVLSPGTGCQARKGSRWRSKTRTVEKRAATPGSITEGRATTLTPDLRDRSSHERWIEVPSASPFAGSSPYAPSVLRRHHRRDHVVDLRPRASAASPSASLATCPWPLQDVSPATGAGRRGSTWFSAAELASSCRSIRFLCGTFARRSWPIFCCSTPAICCSCYEIDAALARALRSRPKCLPWQRPAPLSGAGRFFVVPWRHWSGRDALNRYQ